MFKTDISVATDQSSVECTTSLLVEPSAVQDGPHVHRHSVSPPGVPATGPQLRVLGPGHRAPGSTPLLKKILAFCLCGENPTLCIQAERGKGKQGEGGKCFCLFQRPQTKGKRIPSFNKLKAKDLLADAHLSAI